MSKTNLSDSFRFGLCCDIQIDSKEESKQVEKRNPKRRGQKPKHENLNNRKVLERSLHDGNKRGLHQLVCVFKRLLIHNQSHANNTVKHSFYDPILINRTSTSKHSFESEAPPGWTEQAAQLFGTLGVSPQTDSTGRTRGVRAEH